MSHKSHLYILLTFLPDTVLVFIDSEIEHEFDVMTQLKTDTTNCPLKLLSKFFM